MEESLGSAHDKLIEFPLSAAVSPVGASGGSGRGSVIVGADGSGVISVHLMRPSSG